MFDVGALHTAHQRFVHLNHQMVLRQLARAGEYAEQFGIQRAVFRHRTGAVKRGFQKRVVKLAGGGRMWVRNTAPHADYLERGTKPHVIRARGRCLSFFWLRMSKQMRIKSVRHPGTRAYHFVEQARDQAYRRLSVDLRSSMMKIASQF